MQTDKNSQKEKIDPAFDELIKVYPDFIKNTCICTNDKKKRYLTLDDESLKVLEHKRSIDSDNLGRAIKSVLEKVYIQDFHFHDLRHTFATRLAQRGIDIYKISKLLGHKDIRMTQRYAHHCPESLRDGVQVLEFGHNLVTVGESRNVSNA